MNIVIISSLYKPNIGGVEEAVYNLSKEYKNLGHKVSIITGKWPKNLKSEENIDGINVGRIDFVMPNMSIKGIFNFLFRFFKVFSEFKNKVISKKPDILHIQCAGPNAFYTLLLSYFHKIPLVVTIQGADIQQLPSESKLMRWTLSRLLKRADFITACSQSLIDKDVKKFISSNNKKTLAIYNGVNLKEFNDKDSYSHRRPYIFSIGRFVYKKGFDILIKAFSFIADKIGDVDLIIAGDGPEKKKYENLIKELNLNERIHLIGYSDRKKTVRLFNGCEFFVLPSRKEPQGIVNLEAMSASKAIIATSVDGVPELVKDNFNGLLVESENPEKLANKIELLLKDKKLQLSLGHNGREIVEDRFSWAKIADDYLDVYKTVLNKNEKN